MQLSLWTDKTGKVVRRMQTMDGRTFIKQHLRTQTFGEPDLVAEFKDTEEMNLCIIEFCKDYRLIDDTRD